MGWCVIFMMDHDELKYVSSDSIGRLIMITNIIVRCIHGYICCVGVCVLVDAGTRHQLQLASQVCVCLNNS